MPTEGRQIDDGPREHFIECPECGALIDMRDLRQVLVHERQHTGTQLGTQNTPPATVRGAVTAIRLSPEMLRSVDAWAKKRDIGRSEAIRRLIALALRSQSSSSLT